MYKSPIELRERWVNKTVKEFDDGIAMEIEHQVDVKVDKKELMRALEYDRHQYDAGFEDGKSYAFNQLEEKYEEIKEKLMEIEELFK